MLLAGQDGRLQCIETGSGTLSWQVDLGVPLTWQPAIDSGEVLVASERREISRYRLANGELLARVKLPALPSSSAVAIGDAVILGLRTGETYVMARSTFEPRYRVATNRPVRSRPVPSRNGFVVIADDGRAVGFER
jgi:outer membrane protein assembly factor BamB